MRKDIIRLIQEGHMMIAIQQYRLSNPVSFTEAEKAVYDMRNELRQMAIRPHHQSDASYDMETLRHRVMQHLADGDKIGALRLYCEYAHVGIEEATVVIRELEREHG